MNLKLEIEFSKADILKEVNSLKKQIDDMRPLPPDVEGKVMQKLRLDWNYNSNAIEGNKLDYGETVAFLMTGITAKGKPLKDYLDIRGHNEAILFLTSIIKDDRPLSETDIRELHEMILVEPYEVKAQTPDGNTTSKWIALGKYKSSPNHVITATGEPHYYATPEETEAKMGELINWYRIVSQNTDVHPTVIAALFHHKFAAIHPFDDGNGRLARILMNLILMRNGFPPVIIKKDDRQNYYSLLSQADVGNDWPFIEYITERLQSSLKLYLKAANGEDIDEDDDIDKGIALFKMEVENSVNVKTKKSVVIINNILTLYIEPLINKLNSKSKKFNELFFENYNKIGFGYDSKFSNHESINQFVNSLSLKERDNIIENIKGVGVIFTFKKFRSAENDFNIEAWITILFDEYYYEFVDRENSLILKKMYHENLTDKDEKRIVEAFVDSLKKLISEKLKSSES